MISLDIRTLSPAGMPRVYPKWSNPAKHMKRKRRSKGFPQWHSGGKAVQTQFDKQLQNASAATVNLTLSVCKRSDNIPTCNVHMMFCAIKCNELDWNKRGLTACSLSAYHNYVNANPFARMPFIIRKGEVGHRRHARSVVSPRPSLFVFTQASGAGGHDNSN